MVLQHQGDKGMNLVLLGPPGAGKGTQANLLAAEWGMPAIATGDMFRQSLAEDTSLGRKANSYMERGALVPDEVVIGIVEERLKKEDCSAGFLLDGFPRTLVQAEALDRILGAQNKSVTAAVVLQVDQEDLVRRSSGRRVCKDCGQNYHVDLNVPESGRCQACDGRLVQRPDDNEETIRERLRVYALETAPLIDFYERKGLAFKVDGGRSKDEVFEDVKQILAELVSSSAPHQ